jgi:hypothetical protein
MLTRARVNVVFEGNLSVYSSLRDVLERVHAQPGVEAGVLRIAGPSDRLSGRLAIARGRFIVGAQVGESNESGYEAVRILLTVTSGNFAFLDTGGVFPFSVDPPLHICVDRLLQLWPELPESPVDLFDEKALLDEVFCGSGAAIVLPVDSPPMVATQDQSASPAPADTWAAIQPLLLEQPGEQQQGRLLSGQGAGIVDLRERRITFGKLKAAAITGLSWRRHGPWIAFILLLVLGILAVWPRLAELADKQARSPAPASQAR